MEVRGRLVFLLPRVDSRKGAKAAGAAAGFLHTHSSPWPNYYSISMFLYLGWYVFIFIWFKYFFDFLCVSFQILGCFPAILIWKKKIYINLIPLQLENVLWKNWFLISGSSLHMLELRLWHPYSLEENVRRGWSLQVWMYKWLDL